MDRFARRDAPCLLDARVDAREILPLADDLLQQLGGGARRVRVEAGHHAPYGPVADAQQRAGVSQTYLPTYPVVLGERAMVGPFDDEVGAIASAVRRHAGGLRQRLDCRPTDERHRGAVLRAALELP